MLALILASLVALPVPSPSGDGAMAPHLSTLRDGGVVMSWLEPPALKFAIHRNGKWSAPRVIAQRDDFFVNWADFPSVIEGGDGALYAHWLQKSGPGTFDYDVHVAVSRDGGATWRSRVVHRDGIRAEHGFASLVPRREGVAAVWLDGREMPGKKPMTLRYANVDAALNVTGETVLDTRVCECCTTAMAMTAKGPLVAYRDRTEEEIRDISVVRLARGTWTPPATVHRDHWLIIGCPVNGPQLDARGDRVALAWFTAPRDKPRVNVAFSRDAGATFAAPIRVDDGAPVGRVDVLLLTDGSALVTWIEGTSVVARRVHRDGRVDPLSRIASSSNARSAGFPRTALAGGTAWFAWTEPGTPKRIRLARVAIR